jgi:predicted ATPase
VGLSGGGLADGFQLLQQSLSASEDGEEVLDGVLELIDWVYKVEATSHGASLVSSKVPRTKLMLKFTDRYMARSRNELTAYDASEGALYILFCAVLCLSTQAPKTFAVDNLDQALNPRLLTRLTARLAGWLTRADPGRQMLFTAHNPAVLDGLQLDDPEVRLFAVERNSEGMTVFRRITLSPELQIMNEQYPLSRLWMMGHLGAVPNV